MSDSPQIIEYAHASVPAEIQIRREGNELTVIIPAPPFWRLMTLTLLRLSTLIVLSAIGAVIFYALDSRTLFPCAVTPAVILIAIRMTRVALAGSQPTHIRASPLGLQISPRGMTFLKCNWPASELCDIGVRQAGAVPLLARDLQLRLMFNGDRIETYNIPWNGVGALANVEENLRDMLALPRDSKSTLNQLVATPSDPPSATIN